MAYFLLLLPSASASLSSPCAHPSRHPQAVSPSPFLHLPAQTWSCPRSPPLSGSSTATTRPSFLKSRRQSVPVAPSSPPSGSRSHPSAPEPTGPLLSHASS